MKQKLLQHQADIVEIVAAIKKEAKVFEGKTILVTGSFGFVGQYITATFVELNMSVLKKPCRVIGIDHRRKKTMLPIQDKHISFQICDIVKPLSIPGEVDYIIHAASITPPSHLHHPLETMAIATQGTQNMLELARKKKSKSVLFFSTAEIYGNPEPRFVPTPETYGGSVSTLDPRAYYYESKRLGETYCLAYHNLYRVPIKIVRPFNLYGPSARFDARRVLPRFLSTILKGKKLVIYGTGTQTRTYCYITDAVIGFFKVLLYGASGEAYNIGSDQEVSLLDLIATMSDVVKKKPNIKKVPYPKESAIQDPKRRCPDIRKAKREVGFYPRIDLKTGITRLAFR